jgi:broad specificity phosphatase PhoE
MRLIFVRHGESEANVLRVISNRGRQHGLTARGRKQANTLAEQLRGQAISHIYTSPLLRAEETAAILAAELHLPFEPADALCEYDCGILEGRADAEAWQQHSAATDFWLQQGNSHYKPEGGESFLDIQGRFLPFVQGLVERHRHAAESILLVTHGGLCQLMLPLLCANLDPAFVAAHGMGHTTPVIVEPQGDELVCVDWGGVRP